MSFLLANDSSVKTRKWISKEEFETSIVSSRPPRIVLFAADWCGYCSRFLGIASEYDPGPNKLKAPSDELEVVDIDSGDGSLWDTFNINLVPTLFVISAGKQLFRQDARPLKGLAREDLVAAVQVASSAGMG